MKKTAGRRPPPSLAILLPLGQWPCDDQALEQSAGSDQPELRSSAVPPTVRVREEIASLTRGSASDAGLTGGSLAPSSSYEEGLASLRMPGQMRVALTSGVFAQAL